MTMSYQQRKERGQYKRAVYLRRVDNAEHIATMLRGIALGTAFMAVMFCVAGITTELDALIEFLVLAICGISLVEAEHILFLAEQSRYPKSRRRTFRSEFADEWYELRQKMAERKEKKKS